ncbi:hypothetical protein F5146DRAFT_478923 [Armillaria mellea]|nr:hypothetical protein F5146DRAFT_478923 [Armillaria mellea]
MLISTGRKRTVPITNGRRVLVASENHVRVYHMVFTCSSDSRTGPFPSLRPFFLTFRAPFPGSRHHRTTLINRTVSENLLYHVLQRVNRDGKRFDCRSRTSAWFKMPVSFLSFSVTVLMPRQSVLHNTELLFLTRRSGQYVTPSFCSDAYQQRTACPFKNRTYASFVLCSVLADTRTGYIQCPTSLARYKKVSFASNLESARNDSTERMNNPNPGVTDLFNVCSSLSVRVD